MDKKYIYHTHKYVARIKIEATTPLRIGSGDKDSFIDRPIIRDANGLPFIPGTSIAGIIRHDLAVDAALTNSLFGFQDGQIGQRSQISFSPALLVTPDQQKALEGLHLIDMEGEDATANYYKAFLPRKLPNRDHVRINDKGTAIAMGKFEEELVPRGARFIFEMELEGSAEDQPYWEQILQLLRQNTFRIGAGTRKGFGELKILSCETKEYNLQQEQDLRAYLAGNSSLNAPTKEWDTREVTEVINKDWEQFNITLKAENFFLFGAGIGDEEVDIRPKKEAYFEWTSGQPILTEEQILIPATSVKGAMSHRIAFHYNNIVQGEKQKTSIESTSSLVFEDSANPAKSLATLNFGIDIDSLNIPANSDKWEQLVEQVAATSIQDTNEWNRFSESLEIKSNAAPPKEGVAANNLAVYTLFGAAKQKDEKKNDTANSNSIKGRRGQVLISDVYLKQSKEKILNHVAIDRFTAGGIDGALFQEKVAHSKDHVELKIAVKKSALSNPDVRTAFENTIADLKTGRLQLGGHTTKGHGAFEVVE